jgi:hypothetical protein
MAKSQVNRKRIPKSVLKLPDLEQSKSAKNTVFQALRYVGRLLNDVTTSGLPTNWKMRQCPVADNATCRARPIMGIALS